MINLQLTMEIAAGLYGLCLVVSLVSGLRREVVFLFMLPALFINGAVMVWRYWQAWPMLPMYLGAVTLPLCLGFSALLIRPGRDGKVVQGGVLLLAFLAAMAAVCFPKDFYLPFLKSQTLWAHFFFIFSMAGKTCFLVSATWAMAGLRRNGSYEENTEPISARDRSLRWTIWGFSFWTLSMFSGELWSYLGWGTPVVWDDPAITTAMATWFFYIGLLHLHLTGSWHARGRGIYAATGALVVLVLNCLPDIGPFRWPI